MYNGVHVVHTNPHTSTEETATGLARIKLFVDSMILLPYLFDLIFILQRAASDSWYSVGGRTALS
jgi:hypothetical protein